MNKQQQRKSSNPLSIKLFKSERIGAKTMHIHFKRLTIWLDYLLILTLAYNILLPAQLAVAASLGDVSTAKHIDNYSINESLYLKLKGVTSQPNQIQVLNLTPSISLHLPVEVKLTNLKLTNYQSNGLHPMNDNLSSITLAVPSQQTTSYYYVAFFLGSSGPGTVANPDNSVDGQNGTYMQVDANCNNCYEDVDYSLGGVANGVVSIQVYSYAQADPSTHWPELRFFTSVDGVTWIDRGFITQNSSPQWRTKSFSSSDGISHIRIRSSTGSNLLKLLRRSNIDSIRIQAASFTPDMPSLPPDQTFSKGECPICGNSEKQNYIGDPINSFTGNFNHEVTDLSIPTLGQPLSFERTYNSLATLTSTVVYSRPLGYGWTHNYDINLTFPTGPSGEPNTAILQAPRGSRMRFIDNGDGTYDAFPGVWATITQTGVLTTAVYTVTAANQEAFVFNDLGKITQRIDPQGNTTVFSRTNGITLTRVIDPSGTRHLDFGYDGQGRLTSVTDHTGRSVGYGYDALDNLTVMTDTRGLTWSYVYTSPPPYTGDAHLLHQIIDPDNRAVEQTFFDDQGRATRQLDGLGNPVVDINYVDATTRVITEAGKVYTDTYNASGLLISQTDAQGQQQFGFDSDFNRTGVTDANGNPTAYLRDAFGLTRAITDALGHVTSFTYDGNNNLTSSTDALGRTTQYLYDGQNNLISMTNALSGTTHYTYNAQGQQTSVTDENGHTTQYAYDSFGNRAVITDALGYVTTFEYDDLGRVVTTTDALGKITINEYDAADNLVKVIENFLPGQPQNYTPPSPPQEGGPGGVYNLITEYTYDGAGRRLTTTDTLGRVNRNVYDATGRLAQTIQNEHPTIPTQNYQNEYNLITSYGYDDFGRQVSVTDTLGRETRTEYDAVGRAQKSIVNYVDGAYDPNAPDEDIVTEFVYDAAGNLVNTIDTLGRVTHTNYDALNRVEQTIVNFDNGIFSAATPDEDLVTAYGYDAVGNQTVITDTLGRATLYSYDALNRVITMTNPLGDTMSYQYDPAGNRTSVTNGANETTNFAYDELNRLILTRDPLGNETEYRYDEGGNRTAMIDAEGVETRYGYDTLNRLTSVIENYVDGVYSAGLTDEDVTTRYEYDPIGNRTGIIDARNNETSYEYDTLNRRIAMTDPENNTTQYGYGALGNRTVITDANGIVTTFGYDQMNRLMSIDYSDSTPDVNFTYNGVGNRLTMTDGTGTTTYSYDDADRLTGANDGAGLQVSYGYDGVGNRTNLTYPDSKTVTYNYDDANRLETVTADWITGQFGYTYDNANRLTNLDLPNGVGSDYGYDDAGWLTLLSHSTLTDTLASYAYDLDKVGNRRVLTESLVAIQYLTVEAYAEDEGLVVLEAENGERTNGATHNWLLKSSLPSYTGTSYLDTSLDNDTLVQTNAITTSPKVDYPIDFTTPGTYTIWLRGYPANSAGDSAYVGLDDEPVEVTGFVPQAWSWAEATTPISVTVSGVYTLSLWMREDGLRIDRLLLTTDTNYLPTDFGPPETGRTTIQMSGPTIPLTRTIVYTYDNLYRLTNAGYTSGETYAYDYDPVGNRLQQIINGDTTSYTYDDANRITSVEGQSYTFDSNGNLLSTGVLTNAFDAANRLVSIARDHTILQPIYNGVGDRVGQITDGVTTTLALDVVGLPEVIYTSEGEIYLHLPGVIVTEKAGEVRYLLSDGLGSIRQVVDETAEVVAYQEFDPYGSPVENDGGNPYGYTGEWWESDVKLLHLRARWYLPGDGIFLSRDRVESEPPFQYVRGNPINLVDPSGFAPNCQSQECKIEFISTQIQVDDSVPTQVRNLAAKVRHSALVFTDPNGVPQYAEGLPSGNPYSLSPGYVKANITDPNDENSLNIIRSILENERNGAYGAVFTTLIEGDLACDKWECILAKMKYIESLERPYNLFTSNSNSMVSTALKACGIFIAWSAGINNHSGWNNNLIKPRPVFDPVCTSYPELCYPGPI